MRLLRAISPSGWFWIGAFAISLFLAEHAKSWSRAHDMRWLMDTPRAIRFPIKDDISDFMDWLVNSATFGLFTFTQFTRAISWLIEQPYLLVKSMLVTGWVEGFGDNAVQLLPPFSWIAVIVTVFAMGYYARNLWLGLFVAACFLYLAIFGQWESAMVTLSSILIAVPIGVAGGLLLGILAYRWRWFNLAISPVLDLMQTVPIFAYLVPILFLFGFGPVAALLATIIYAMPPMVRITTLALKSVPEEIREFGLMAGCTNRQMTWKVLVPAANRSLMVGVNQVIMLSLNMVIIASMIGAGGLGYDVLTSLRRLDIGGGLEAGVAIVVLAIALDRLSQAFADRNPPDHSALPASPVRRHPWITTCLLVALGTGLAGLFLPALQTYPRELWLTTGDFWSKLVEYINVNFFDQIEAVKTFMLVTFLVPVKRFLLGLPWPWVIALLTFAGWRLGRWRLALLVFLMSLFILVNDLWDKAMVTVYLVGVSVIIASLIGIPIGIWSAQHKRADRIVAAVIDTLQTLPSFVYLIPVVMLFRVGDFSAMIAVVLYALAPAVRYASHGIKSVDPQLIEAGIVSGCTRRQLLWRIRLPLALPEIMLGINQTLMLAISMLVITALVGTRELGQEVYIALTKADTGRGIVAGLSIAFIAIIADRMIAAGAARARKRLGLEEAR
ncbi:ABC transporter permease subunit [Hoeflea sp. WL0058]|uniref:ABC transporter permease subunit n=1 Tax=Flavimaribacter sediminis TaxID=2865987 RepID=A0AAE2ZS23_9HYPH|nr:ABC transporter permease subunit [Flavimaribacter sediminis]MBW8639795.1 ABC transporter permease subunit [Flavimaribacter sediminis]